MFRRILAGRMFARAMRETWTLTKHDGDELVLHLDVDMSSESLVLDGSERVEKNWHNVASATWSVLHAPDLHLPASLALETTHGDMKRTRFARIRPDVPPVGSQPPPVAARPLVPPMLTMTCVAKKLSVFPPTATLVHGDACDGTAKRPHWKGASRKSLDVERCSFAELAQNASDMALDADMNFAREPGIELAYENSDCAAEEGAYRQVEGAGGAKKGW